MEAYLTRFEWKNKISGRKDAFNGEYITFFTRIPNIGEEVCFDGANRYKVVNVISELKGWKEYYTIILD